MWSPHSQIWSGRPPPYLHNCILGMVVVVVVVVVVVAAAVACMLQTTGGRPPPPGRQTHRGVPAQR